MRTVRQACRLVTSGLLPAVLAAGVVVLTATPAGADVASVSGGAFGLSAGGLVQVGPTPVVSLPGTGGGPYEAVQSAADVPGLVEVAGIEVSTAGSTGPGGQVQSSAGVQLADVLGGTLTVGGLASSCTSSESGSVGATTVTELQVDGVDVALPDPVPPDYGISVPGIASVTLNYQMTSNGPYSTSVTVDALHLALVGGLVTVDVAGSSCGMDFSVLHSNG